MDTKITKELEDKVISCNKNLTVRSISIIFNISTSKIYQIFRKHGLSAVEGRTVKALASGKFTPYGRRVPKKRSKHSTRICKPYKTSQLT